MASFPKRGLSKKDFDEKKKKHEQEKEAAKAFEEFVQTFDEEPANTAKGKVWVKAGTFNAGTREETSSEKGQLYKPTSRFEPSAPAPERKGSPENITRSRIAPIVRKKDGKKKSNLELFKEELKRIQEEREERHKLKEQLKEATSSGRVSRFEAPELPPITPSPLSLDVPNPYGSFDSGDPTTTNLYLGNLAAKSKDLPKLSEQKLMEIFGRYGPLASIKIMWPRNDEERIRGRNCGFVAFMTRADAEAALEDLSGKEVEGYEMKLGWGKAVPIPPQPIYIPPSLLEISKPPPPSGLPFNAQPRKKDKEKLPLSDQMPEDPAAMRQFNKMLQRAVVKVVIPTERQQLMIIHRMVEFVVREGPLFEAMIMNKEMDNPMYRFLFDNQSHEHTYYRWKLYCIMFSDSPQRWRTDEFRMFKGGSVWKPPPMNPYMMDRTIKKPEPESKRNKSLSESQRVRFESKLRHLSCERDVIGEAMVWCLDHADSAEEISQCLTESLSHPNTQLIIKTARLFLVSDILHNCTAKVANASKFRKCFQERLLDMFEGIHSSYSGISSRLKAEAFKQRVMRVFRAWEDWAIYPQDFLIKLQNTFLGFTKQAEEGGGASDSSDLDGAPLSDSDDVDGVPLDGAALLKKAARRNNAGDAEEEDVDGVPLEDVDGQPLDGAPAASRAAVPASGGGFVPSRWETVDPHDVAAGAVTTSKWEAVSAAAGPRGKEEHAEPAADTADDGDDDVDGVPLDETTSVDESQRSKANTPSTPDTGDVSEERRQKLREVELKVVAYQDDLESGQRSVKSGYTLQEQVQHYRAKLMRKVEKQLHDRKRRRGRSGSSSEEETQKYSSRKRSRSPQKERGDRTRRRSRSHSPSRRRRRSRSRSRSRSPGHRRSRSPQHRRSRSRSRSRSPSRKSRKKSKR